MHKTEQEVGFLRWKEVRGRGSYFSTLCNILQLKNLKHKKAGANRIREAGGEKL